MSESDKKQLLKELKDYKKEVTSSKKASRKFLVELGVVDKDGNKTKAYENLCIQ
jgi:hypothetical protein